MRVSNGSGQVNLSELSVLLGDCAKSGRHKIKKVEGRGERKGREGNGERQNWK